jgi:hypothetical protein
MLLGHRNATTGGSFSKASEINRNDLLEYKEKKINKRVPLVLTYHPSLEKIAGIVRHHCMLTHGQERLFREVTSVSIHFSYVLRPADVTVKHYTRKA